MSEDMHSVVLLLESKLDQLLEVVNEIKGTVSVTNKEVADLKIKINTLENKTDQQQHEIDKLYQKNDDNRKWILGIVSSVGAGLILAILKFGFKL